MEVLLLAEPVIAEIIAVVGGEDDQRVVEAAQRVERLPDPAQVIVDLLHESLIRGANRAPDLVAHEIRAFFLLPVRRDHGMRVLELAWFALDGRALLDRIPRVIRCRR